LADFQSCLTGLGRAAVFADQEERRVEVQIHDRDVNLLIRRLAGRQVTGFTERKASLEDYFLGFYETRPEGDGHGRGH
jgi:hypothetical protein